MKKVLKSHVLMTVVAVGCLWFGFISTAHDFATFRDHMDTWFQLLIDIVHEEHWDIAYSFGEDCPEDRHAETQKMEAAITLALQTWLQPLREIETEAPIVNEFRFHQLPPITLEVLQDPEWAHLDLGVNDHCNRGKSSASLLPNLPPRVSISAGAEIDVGHIYTLIHEIGHAFGMGDTYVERAMKPSVTKGGLDATVGTQPAAAMSMHVYVDTGHYLTEDDINGIIWLYKATYKDLPPEDCLFPNYVFEADPKGCVPKYPLIFEIKQGHERYARWVLRDDENIDVNAQDDTGLTALHYAVRDRYTRVVEALLEQDTINVNLTDARGQTALHYAVSNGLKNGDIVDVLLAREDINVNIRDESGSTALHYAISKRLVVILNALLSHKDIWVHPRNKAGKTPIGLARDLGDKALADRLLKHPNYQLSVTPKGKLATTWARLKRRD